MVRPGQIYRLSALILQSKTLLLVKASIQCNGVEVGAASSKMKIGIAENLMIKVCLYFKSLLPIVALNITYTRLGPLPGVSSHKYH